MPSASIRHDGFTLVELVVVIAILGIVSAVVAPKFFSWHDYEERAFSDECIAALRYAQKRAVASQCDIRIEINTTGYALYRHQSVAGCGSAPSLTTLVTSPSGEDYKNENSPLPLTPATIVFDALGRSRNGSYSVQNFTNVAGLGIAIAGETGCVTQ